MISYEFYILNPEKQIRYRILKTLRPLDAIWSES